MNTDLQQAIKNKAKQFLSEVTDMRRHLHQYPELSFEEEQTSAFIQQKLGEWNIPFTKGWGGHGIVAFIEGSNTEKVVALRADMDALPITETNNTPYKSLIEGKMHACGHDVHMASLLGASRILHELREYLPHSIRLIFQPGEEKLPGGASIMIREGVLQNPVPLHIIGQHVFPDLEAGKVGVRAGMYMASADEIYITVKGKGGHAAMPQDCQDTILASCEMITALQQIVSRRANPAIPTVLSFGKIQSEGGATNIIPEKVKIEGTFRTMDESWREKAHALIKDIAVRSCSAFGAECDIEILKGYPCLINEAVLTNSVRKQMQIYLGEENVVELPIRMTSEDFAFYSKEIPACFYRLGTGNREKGITSAVHTPKFDIDESSLETGMGLMAWLAVTQH